MIVCRLCGRQLGQMTGIHLKSAKCRDAPSLGRRLTLREYMSRYPEAKHSMQHPTKVVRYRQLQLYSPKMLHKISNGKPQKDHPLYASHRSMITRCYNTRASNYVWYGARGIGVCDRWRHGADGRTGLECFADDMGPRPTGRTLERIDGNSDYSPVNCRWATAKEQSRNNRACKLSTADVLVIAQRLRIGESYKAIAADFGVTPTNIGCIARGITWSDLTGFARKR